MAAYGTNKTYELQVLLISYITFLIASSYTINEYGYEAHRVFVSQQDKLRELVPGTRFIVYKVYSYAQAP
jgi:hypothetical protein